MDKYKLVDILSYIQDLMETLKKVNLLITFLPRVSLRVECFKKKFKEKCKEKEEEWRDLRLASSGGLLNLFGDIYPSAWVAGTIPPPQILFLISQIL